MTLALESARRRWTASKTRFSLRVPAWRGWTSTRRGAGDAGGAGTAPVRSPGRARPRRRKRRGARRSGRASRTVGTTPPDGREAEVEIGSLESEIAGLDRGSRRRMEKPRGGGRSFPRPGPVGRRKTSSWPAAREGHRLAQEEVERAKSDLIVRVSQHSDARSGAEACRSGSRRGTVHGPSSTDLRAVAAVEKASARPRRGVRREIPRGALGSRSGPGEHGAALAAANATLDESVRRTERRERASVRRNRGGRLYPASGAYGLGLLRVRPFSSTSAASRQPMRDDRGIFA